MPAGTNLGTAYGYIEIADNVDQATKNAKRQFNRAIDSLSGRMEKFGDKMSGVGQSIGLLAAPLVGIGALAITASVEFESAFANVKKTVGGTNDEMKLLETQLRQMAISDSPIGKMDDALLSLTEISQMAGSLSVPIDEIAKFSETVALLASASDDLDPEQAATFIGQFRNVTGMKFDQVGKLADTIVTLGNNMATTEGRLSAFALRLAPLANYNWKPDAILAYAAALDSLGVSPELGGTNLMKSIMDLNVAVANGGPDLERWAQAAGMAASEFSALAQSDPEGAFRAFIEGLGKMDATEQILTLQELNITSNEQITTLQRLAGGQTTLNDALIAAQAAWGGNNAALREAEAKGATTQGTLNKLNNHLYDMRINLGNALTDGLANFANGMIPVIDSISAWAVANPGLVQTIGGLVLAIGGLSAALIVGGMVISNAAVVLGALGAAYAAVTGSTWLATAGTWAMNAATAAVTIAVGLFRGALALALGPIGIIAMAVAGLIALLTELEARFGAVSAAADGLRYLGDVLDPTAANRRAYDPDNPIYAEPDPNALGPKQREIPSFWSGGYTGDGPKEAPAGIVHKGEFVLSQEMLRGMFGGGGRKVADTIIVNANDRAGGYAAGRAFEDELTYLIRAT